MRVNIASPQIGKEEIKAVTDVMKSGMLAQGPKVKEFEEKFAKFIGTKYAVATSSGTTALEVALRAHGIGTDDEVITTSFTFIASANSILYTGARPVFTDINETTFNLDPEKIEKAITKKTKAILPVHLYGQACDMTKIMAIARKHKLIVIEDACQSHGAEYRNKKVGSFGTSAFSLYPTKNMTTGEGGMITTNSKEIYDQANLIRAHGSKIKYYHDILGYNYRMTDIEGAIGIEQLKKLNKFNSLRIKNAKFLNKNLGKIAGIIVPEEAMGAKHVYHQYTIRVIGDFGGSRDNVLKKLTEAGIGTAVFYPLPLNEQKVYQDLGYKSNTPIAKKVSEEVLSLPVHPELKTSDLNYIVKAFQKMAQRS
ncbi:MAG: putative pyridoxal phosphate-dependent enzyme [Berkelbacteria bacterium GW2011_GWA1_36_9]|uniref:Putative pyridoxal phosphate-dependent enzyme n=1 Tax=Berkelbacteria bacterium GW2011_GWA1_36_9 TaxID=1618331 RepID=A0A0G0FLV1_9BACT|nr:MAG: putative pyridoxal phosphate-dependent enzyme [Berkelbacteria bacterium GW2011_GWA1_36_9]